MKQFYSAIQLIIGVSFLLIINSSMFAQQASNVVKGVVKNQKGESMQGVTVTIQNPDSSIVASAVTSSTGTFTFNNLKVGNTYQLVFSHVGYENQVIRDYRYNGADVINLSLQLSATSDALNEVVVVGYGTQKKLNLTGAIDQVSGDVLDNRAVPNLSQGLQGIIPNLNIRLGDGKPTQAPAYNIRGNKSIGQGGSALVLIDGVEGDPSMINPADIATISVLKDAASAAIYGARGSFGVTYINVSETVNGVTNPQRLKQDTQGEITWLSNIPRVFEEKHYLYPIPENDRLMNPKLGQNPQW